MPCPSAKPHPRPKLRRRHAAVLAAGLLLSACGGAGAPVKSAGTAPAATRAPVRAPMPAKPHSAEVHMIPGLEGVIGAGAGELVRQFGPARLDVLEGDARKLQFTGKACILDVYLYPGAPGRDPQATYADARRASDGQDVDRAACVSALRQR